MSDVDPATLQRCRDGAVLALHEEGLSSTEIAALAVRDVRVFESGRVTVRLRPGDGILRGVRRRPRFVLLDGDRARRMADYLLVFGIGARQLALGPLFVGRRSRALTDRSIRLLLHRISSAAKETA